MARMMQRGDQSSIGQEGKTAVAAAGKGGDRCSGKRVWNRYGVVEDWRDQENWRRVAEENDCRNRRDRLKLVSECVLNATKPPARHGGRPRGIFRLETIVVAQRHRAQDYLTWRSGGEVHGLWTLSRRRRCRKIVRRERGRSGSGQLTATVLPHTRRVGPNRKRTVRVPVEEPASVKYETEVNTNVRATCDAIPEGFTIGKGFPVVLLNT